jgi:hypothetical protein
MCLWGQQRSPLCTAGLYPALQVGQLAIGRLLLDALLIAGRPLCALLLDSCCWCTLAQLAFVRGGCMCLRLVGPPGVLQRACTCSNQVRILRAGGQQISR